MDMIENEYIKFWKDEGILYSAFKQPIYAELEDTKAIIELRHTISNNESQYWVMDMRNLKSVSNDAKNYIDKKGHELVWACAVITSSFLTKFMINVFINIKESKVPIKVFSSEENAVAWLKELKDSNNTGINLGFKEDQLS